MEKLPLKDGRKKEKDKLAEQGKSRKQMVNKVKPTSAWKGQASAKPSEKIVMEKPSEPEDNEEMDCLNDGIRLTVNASDDDLSGQSEDEADLEREDMGENSMFSEGEIPDSQSEPGNLQNSENVKLQQNNNRTCEEQPQQNTTASMGMSITSDEDALRFIEANPHFGNVFKKMIQEGIAEEKRTSKGKNANIVVGIQHDKCTKNDSVISAIKSPSDTTIYAPALNKATNQVGTDHMIDHISNFVEGIRLEMSSSDRTLVKVGSHWERTDVR